VRTNGSTLIKFKLSLSGNKTKTNEEWKWAQYSLDNSLTNPFKLWTQQNCPPFPSDELFEEMRKQEVTNTYNQIFNLKVSSMTYSTEGTSY